MRRLFKGGYYINLPVLERRLLFKGGIYSRGALIQGNTVFIYLASLNGYFAVVFTLLTSGTDPNLIESDR